jgi:hypothetical protein
MAELEKILNEITYYSFKNETKFRTKSEQLHKAVKEIKKRVYETHRLLEYTERLKRELSEGEQSMKYWKATNNTLGRIAETVNQIGNKLKNLIQ